MSYFAVSKYQDTIKVKKEKELFGAGQLEYYTYFDAEAPAKAFIIRRARIKLENAEAEVRRAKRQLAKVVKRFGDADSSSDIHE